MLEVTHLSRCYGDFKAVDGVSFNIGKGEIVGLLGHNGAGKTTIMKMLSGYLEPDTGSVKIDGISMADKPKTLQRQLGYLPENLPVYGEMTVADYLDYAASLKGLDGQEKIDEIRRALTATELADKLHARIHTLSRGYKQRVGVAQAILGRPRLLILDEPTNGLDPTQTRQMRALIKDIAREATVILSTHIMQEVEALCDRVLIIHRGRLAVDENLDQLRRANSILLETSATDAREVLGRLGKEDGIERIEPQKSAGQFRILLNEDANLRSASAVIARTLIAAGGELYRLQPEQRDLESLFRQVNENSKDEKTEALDNAA
ncbi:ABC transporter ATP-binding protein [Microbulbifer hydrolyticus]|uniref:ABC-2 type transport system ATP-binding protein n=1 Tax=Microbulbifer hydrolyticus TaxID=48074 RepID=A0A6P1TA05_9GAMM|nr:ABC transporter ATP-binding protein [Microbulbifer hydrolyticus]MBB5211139.1 ABC-2 type transport system ATP-binding protein [Microbulbifer hydrolyticus]QHQ38079.1 ATP-binding cassette domain-containing protein [Microbulbifer hydrolyticus]